MPEDLEHTTESTAALKAHLEAVYSAKVAFTGAVGWLCVWLFIPGALAIWLILVGVYSLLLASHSLAASYGYRGSVAQREWCEKFFRTSGWLVMSGAIPIIVFVFLVFLLGLAGGGLSE